MATGPLTEFKTFDGDAYPLPRKIPAPGSPPPAAAPLPRAHGGGMTGLAVFLVLLLFGLLLAVLQHRGVFSTPAPLPDRTAPLPATPYQEGPPTS